MQLTSDYIHQHKTERGAWTRKQVEALGVRWPPTNGWIDRIAGKDITEAQRVAFEQGRTEFAKRTLKRHRQSARRLF